MDLKKYVLPDLNYSLTDLAPAMSEAQLGIHYSKHHHSYVNSANAILEKLDKTRGENADLDMKAALKEFSFQLGGHILHSIFWENLAPAGRGGGGEPNGSLKKEIMDQYKSLNRFKKEFSQTALSVEGSGWATLVYCKHTGRLLLMQIEKHNANVIPGHAILLALDVFEHAYYLDYKNDRAKYIDSFWDIINWSRVDDRLEKVM